MLTNGTAPRCTQRLSSDHVKLFGINTTTAPTTRSEYVYLIVTWAVLGAIAGILGELGLNLIGGGKVLVSLQEWTPWALVAALAVTFASIPLVGIIRLRQGRCRDWSRQTRRSLNVLALAFPWATLLAQVLFPLFQNSWEYTPDGAVECFLLFIPISTAAAIIAGGLLSKDVAPDTP
jgi:hypothetical protein